MKRKEFNYAHPSFGALQISRVSGGNGNFFGSELKPQHYIELRIYNAELNKNEFCDTLMTKEHIVSVKMTNSQWAEAITTLNHGSGTPCTIQGIQGVRVEQMKYNYNSKDALASTMNSRIKESSEEIDELLNRVSDLFDNKKQLNKQDKADIIGAMRRVSSLTKSTSDFLLESFVERMDDIVTNAKTEIDQHINYKITTAGKTALGISNETYKNIIE